MKITHYSRQILMKLEFSRQILEKYSILKCNKNRPLGAMTTDIQMNKYGKANCRFW
jgi:hypothetical protein